MFNLSPIYSACKSSNHKLSKSHKISPDKACRKHTQTSNKIFEELFPLVLPLFKKKKKKHGRLGHTGSVEDSVDLSIPDFQKVYIKKEWTEAIRVRGP